MSRHLGFVEALRRRHAVARRGWPGVALVLARRPAPPIRSGRPLALSIASRAEVRVAIDLWLRTVLGRSIAPAPGHAATAPPMTPRRVEAANGVLRREIVERLSRRDELHTAVITRAARAVTERVERRLQVVTAHHRREETVTEVRTIARRDPPAAASPAPALAPLSPAERARVEAHAAQPVAAAARSLDVATLTTEVMRAIDQRIIAQRERLGRP